MGNLMPKVLVKLEPLEREIAILYNQDLSSDAVGRSFSVAVNDALLDGQTINRSALGYVPSHKTFMDGSERSNLSGVEKAKIVSFEFALLGDVIEWVDEQLIIHSPVKSERYARSHTWFADGVEFDVASIPPAESYIVLSTQPYARKIEKGLSPQAPDGVYEAVATLAKRRFGNIAYVGFSFRSFPGGAVGKWADSASAAKLAKDVRGGRQSQHRDWLTRQPCIYIDPGR